MRAKTKAGKAWSTCNTATLWWLRVWKEAADSCVGYTVSSMEWLKIFLDKNAWNPNDIKNTAESLQGLVNPASQAATLLLRRTPSCLVFLVNPQMTLLMSPSHSMHCWNSHNTVPVFQVNEDIQSLGGWCIIFCYYSILANFCPLAPQD